MSTVRKLTLTILSGAYESDIIPLPRDVLISTMLVPSETVGNDLVFFGSMGEVDESGNPVMHQLNFSFDLTSTDPVYRGQIVTSLAEKFTGLTHLQVSTQAGNLQTQDIFVLAGYTY